MSGRSSLGLRFEFAVRPLKALPVKYLQTFMQHIVSGDLLGQRQAARPEAPLPQQEPHSFQAARESLR